jgi:hypothetical protein
MKSRRNLLPDRFPIGTRYIVEGRCGPNGVLDVQSRTVEFPDGRHVELPVKMPPRERRRFPRGGASRQKKSSRRWNASPAVVLHH